MWLPFCSKSAQESKQRVTIGWILNTSNFGPSEIDAGEGPEPGVRGFRSSRPLCPFRGSGTAQTPVDDAVLLCRFLQPGLDGMWLHQQPTAGKPPSDR